MVKIYALMNGEEVLYVGQTSTSLTQRAYEHRSVCNQCGSRNIPSDVQWEIKLLEECEEYATEWERFYVEMYAPPYNKQIPGRTVVERRLAYGQTEAGKECQRRYSQTEAGKECQMRYNQTEARKESKKRYKQKKKLPV